MVETILAFVLAGLVSGEPQLHKGVGQPAPKLDDVVWVQGRAVKRFARGTIYVVDFWAPWSGFCRDARAHLAELRSKHADDRVAFVSVSIFRRADAEPVELFVEKRSDIMDHTVARDRVGKLAAAWGDVIDLALIPQSVIVDATGKIAWTGHPLAELEPVLAALVAGDRAGADAIVSTWDAQREKAAAHTESYAKGRRYGLWSTLPDTVDTLMALDESYYAYTARSKYAALVHRGRTEQAAEYGRQLVAGPLAQREWQLEMLAWFITSTDAVEDGERDLELALAASTRANELASGKDWSILDTLARVHFQRGEADEAIACQRQSIEQSFSSYERERTEATLAAYLESRKPPEKERRVDDDA